MKPHVSLPVLASLAAAAFFLPAPASAQKNNNELNQAREKIQRLERDVQERDRRINELKNQVNAAVRSDDPRVRDLERRLRERDAELSKLRDDANRKLRGSMVHSELFSFKSTIGSDRAGQLIGDASKRLSKIDGVRGVYIGRPQNASEQEYDYAMVVILDSGTPLDRLTGSDGYKSLKTNYAKSRIYDFQK